MLSRNAYEGGAYIALFAMYAISGTHTWQNPPCMRHPGDGPAGREPTGPSLRAELLQVSIQLAHAQQFRRRCRHEQAREARYYQHRKSAVRGPPADSSFEPSQELEAGEPSKRRGRGDFGEEHEEAPGLAISGAAIQEHEKHDGVDDDAQGAR